VFCCLLSSAKDSGSPKTGFLRLQRLLGTDVALVQRRNEAQAAIASGKVIVEVEDGSMAPKNAIQQGNLQLYSQVGGFYCSGFSPSQLRIEQRCARPMTLG
jgi:hypothetical protein